MRDVGELDAELLETPFRARTKIHVNAGAPSCGKTTLIDLLLAHGYGVLPGPARACLEAEIAQGGAAEDIHRRGAA